MIAYSSVTDYSTCFSAGNSVFTLEIWSSSWKFSRFRPCCDHHTQLIPFVSDFLDIRIRSIWNTFAESYAGFRIEPNKFQHKIFLWFVQWPVGGLRATPRSSRPSYRAPKHCFSQIFRKFDVKIGNFWCDLACLKPAKQVIKAMEPSRSSFRYYVRGGACTQQQQQVQ